MPTIKERDREVIWHPYTPMKVWPEAVAIVKGEGAYLIDEDGNRYLDAISSWWVNIHGHSNPYIAKKVSEQAAELEHCIFAGFTHEPAVRLAERLLDVLPGAMRKIFYSDNGSTAVEVALKMSLQYWRNKGVNKKKIVALQNAYHGDTFGAMAVSGRSIFTEAFADLLFDVKFIPFPDDNGEHSIAVLEEILQKGDVAAFIVEPLVQGSAGMYMYSPAVLSEYFELCRKYGALIIADEVMTGFGRTGPLFACNYLQYARPDLVCLSKGLTGGAMPLGVTACTQDIFDAFYVEDRTKMLYHGHSFTANPIACAAALASLDLLLLDSCTDNRQRILNAHKAFAEKIKGHPLIKEVRQTGTIIALELKTDSPSYHSGMRDVLYRFFLGKKIIMRPLGNIIYTLPPYCIASSELEYIYTCIEECLAMNM